MHNLFQILELGSKTINTDDLLSDILFYVIFMCVHEIFLEFGSFTEKKTKNWKMWDVQPSHLLVMFSLL